MKSSQWQFLSALRKQGRARWSRPASKNRRGSAALLGRHARSKLVQVLCAGSLAMAALGVTFASGGAGQFSSQSSTPAQFSTSLNGPGNVFLTAGLFGSGGAGTAFVAVADFNGDGKLDYVTANNGNNTTTLGIALGNGDGTFKTPSTIAIPCGALYVATGDFNGDGKTDLAVASADCSPGTNGVEIFLGNGDGTFTAKGTLTSPLSNPFSVAAGDFNGDGKLDLAVVDRGSSTDAVFFYSGNGDGTFQAPTSVSLGVSAAVNQIVAADFNKDGHLDVAVSEINGSNVVVILGNGNGTFQAPRNNALPAQGWGIAVGDFNGDGIPDLVATSPSIGGVTVFLGKGDGNFTPVNNPISGTLPTANADVPGGGCTAIAVGDFNKDGKLDIAAGLAGVNTAALVAVLPGNGDGTFAPERLFGTADTPQSIAVGDFNGDGNLDWIASTGQINSANQGSVTVALGRGDDTFLTTEGYVAGQVPAWAAEADFNKDGKLDVVVPNQPSQNISIFLGKGDGTLQPATNIAFPALNPGSSTCTASPASVPPAGSASYAFTVTVGNTSNVMFVPQVPFRGVPGLLNGFALMLFPILLFVLWAARPGATNRYARRLLVPAVAVLLFCVLYSTGCGGGSGGGGPQPPTNAVLKVTGTSNGVNRTVSLNLTVTH